MKLFFNPNDDMSPHVDLIYSIVKYTAPDVVLEIGVKGGVSTKAILKGMTNSEKCGEYYGCDIKPKIFQSNLLPSAKFLTISSDNLAKEWAKPIDFLFIDGDHHYEQVKRDYLHFSEFVTLNGFMIFHDTFPPNDNYKSGKSCGTAFMVLDDLRKDLRFESVTLPYSFGLTICRRIS